MGLLSLVEVEAAAGRVREDLGTATRFPAATSTAGWIAERPPEPCAQVRILPRALLENGA